MYYYIQVIECNKIKYLISCPKLNCSQFVTQNQDQLQILQCYTSTILIGWFHEAQAPPLPPSSLVVWIFESGRH